MKFTINFTLATYDWKNYTTAFITLHTQQGMYRKVHNKAQHVTKKHIITKQHQTQFLVN